MNKMKEVAKLLGIELNEPFEIENWNWDNPFTLKSDGLYDGCGVLKRDTILRDLITGELKIKKQWKPEIGGIYFSPQIYNEKLFENFVWNNDSQDIRLLERGLVCKKITEAIALAKKMLEVAKKENKNG